MPKMEAAVEIGSTGIRMLIAEELDDGTRNILDRSELAVSLGRDVFTTGTISRETLLQCLLILNRFKEQLAGWRISEKDTTVVATSAFREAKNRDSVLDRIMVKTGFRVKVIDGIEENRLMFLAVNECLKGEDGQGLIDRNGNSVILEVGGGSTEIMLLKDGKIAGAHSMRLGTVIIEQQLRRMGSMPDAKRYIDEFINNTKIALDDELDLGKVRNFIAIGSDMQLAALFSGRPVSAFLWEMTKGEFDAFMEEVQKYSTEEIAARFKIPYNEADSLSMNLLVFQMFLNRTEAERILVPETSLREGIFISNQNIQNVRKEFYSQILASALALLRKYHGDEKHAQHVRHMCLTFFDSLKDELGLEESSAQSESHCSPRLLLEIAALLHDIGSFIRTHDHNKHSKYIIEHSEIFGLNREDIQIVSQIALYHRESKRMKSDKEFVSLPRDARLTILKLTAILKIADSLDRAHTQRIGKFRLSFTTDTMTIVTDGSHNNVLEKIAIEEKSDLFESIFGYRVMLR